MTCMRPKNIQNFVFGRFIVLGDDLNKIELEDRQIEET